MKRLLFLFLCLFSIAILPIGAIPSNIDAQGRIGIPGAGDWELGLLDQSGGPLTQGEYNWNSGSLVAWELSFNSSSNTLTWLWDVGGAQQQSLSTTVSTGLDNGIRVWAKTSNQVEAGESVVVTDLLLTTGSSAESGSDVIASGPSQFVDFVFSTPVSGDFTLSGKSAMTWVNSPPTRSHMQFHINDMNLAVPEPGTLLILSSGLSLALAAKRRRSSYRF